MASQDPISNDEGESDSEDSYFRTTPIRQRAPVKNVFDETTSDSEVDESEVEIAEPEEFKAGNSEPERSKVENSESERKDAKSGAQKSHTKSSSRVISSSSASRKRKTRDTTPHHRRRHHRLAGHYIDEYRLLYNEEVRGACNKNPAQDPQYQCLNSQIGSSIWTAREKNVMFCALARFGIDALPKITAAIGTKSEIQVREYILLLQDGLKEHVLNDQQLYLSEFGDVDAAVELSEECCRSLDMAGEALSWRQDKFDAEAEKKKHGAYWLLTPETAEQIEDARAAGMEEHAAGSQTDGEQPDDPSSDQGLSNEAMSSHALASVPAADLLNLPNWISLSERVFMNSKAEHWEDICDPGESPSIYYTTFQDFHQLAISITRRLVQATIFQASSRIRSENYRPSRNPQARVREWDVQAAIDVLGMKHNSKDYWATLPRRLDLDVYERPPSNTRKNTADSGRSVLTQAYVEYQLGLSHFTEASTASGTLATEAAEPNEPSDTVSSSSSNDDDDDMSVSDTDPHTTASELRAEYIDAQRSRAEELRLWDMLQLSPPPFLATPSSNPAPQQSNSRPTISDLTSWRDTTTYTPLWSTHGGMKRIKTHAPARARSHGDTNPNPNDTENPHPNVYIPKRFRTPPPSLPAAKVPRPDPKVPKPVPHSARTTASQKAAAKARAIEGTPLAWDDSEPEDVPEGGLLVGPSEPRILPQRRAREEAREGMGAVEYPAWEDDEGSEGEWRGET
ncbi:hypothetical protein EJ05DRAFT_291969 [Pseudovirgaria hyperparasitica]|uniref:Myb-like domain-containing protein n=1 Tax=Pseudovirgaria hyperparasitica TaxID=470096 RepID=A0A6A6WD61_9PEZI|nr:uncharacterized protein EJ05DRAFT_291969 [Pseudovirgaria hyperparasitica]KAF2760643.1 hypothetical protein EJ05DRAFT_291969 [Pseudovirgaria hyperparasitica]